VPIGVAVGLVSAYALVPLLEWPLKPFVSHLNQRLSAPAHQLTAHVNGPGYVILGLFVCVGSPVVEELFFRGLLLRGVLGWLLGRSSPGRLIAPSRSGSSLPPARPGPSWVTGSSAPKMSARAAAAVAVVVCGIAFGLAHFEAVELLALSGFGAVLGVLALRSGRLGPGIIAHGTFNAVTIISLAHSH
jgi:membrane protease YdiL (CAAX protease family)